MGKICFTKMHGLGNDFIIIDSRENIELKEIFSRYKIGEFVRYMCNRNFGIGANGVILLDTSKIANFKMRIFNCDGTEAQMCGNGIRCLAKYIYDNKLIYENIIKIETISGIKEIKKEEYFSGPYKEKIDEYIVNMGRPRLLGIFKINYEDTQIEVIHISVGNPHSILFVDDVEKIKIKKIGEFIENYKYFSQKTNVEFVQILDPNLIKIRVWERGIGETFACGTGACASVVAGVINNYTKRNVKVLLKGGELDIEWKEKNGNILMKGIATKVFDGIIEI